MSDNQNSEKKSKLKYKVVSGIQNHRLVA